METKVLVVSASPIKGGSVESFRSKIAEFFSSNWGTPIETAALGELNVRECEHCNWCNKKQEEGKYCTLDDDAQPIFEHLESSDILVLVTPVCFMRTSARMANFIDRLRLFMWGNLTKRRLKNKIGVSAAVSWVRHGGV